MPNEKTTTLVATNKDFELTADIHNNKWVCRRIGESRILYEFDYDLSAGTVFEILDKVPELKTT